MFGLDYLQCVDVNECERDNACGQGARCTNLRGSHTCECPEGFKGDPYNGGCIDIDECLSQPCGENAVCTNVPGSFSCTCKDGFQGDPSKSCTGLIDNHFYSFKPYKQKLSPEKSITSRHFCLIIVFVTTTIQTIS